MNAPLVRAGCYRDIVCATCGQTARRYGTLAKYCEPCSLNAARARGLRYSQTERSRHFGAALREQDRETAKSAIVDAGKQLSESGGLAFAPPSPEYDWIVRFKVPFSYAVSKNHIYGYGHHVFKRGASRQIEAAIEAAARSALRGINVVQNKVWVGLIVEKSNHRGDAVNVVDIVCDGLKKAANIDDRWFSMAFVDWRINKNDPHILIQMGQESPDPVQVCSHCGRLRGFEHFTKAKYGLHGIGRVCRECSSLGRSLHRERIGRRKPGPKSKVSA